jgi:hypothetical protein
VVVEIVPKVRGSTRVAIHAGATPKATAAINETPKAKNNTGMEGDALIGIPAHPAPMRIRWSSPTKVVESPERVAETIRSTYSAPNLTTEEIQSGVGKRDDPLREFSNICRRELESLRGVL